MATPKLKITSDLSGDLTYHIGRQSVDSRRWFRALRDRHGLTNRGLADAVGATKRTADGWLLGRPPGREYLHAIAAYAESPTTK